MYDSSRMRTSQTGIVAFAILLAAAGCSSDPQPTAARADYDNGRFESAHRRAAQQAARTSGGDRAEAAYLAGVSAYRMGDFEEAEKQFFMANESRDPVIVGRTNATLGLMRKQQGRPASSAGFFKVAAEKLEGEEAAIAAREAAAAYTQLGRSYDAEQMMKIAKAKATGKSAPPVVEDAARTAPLRRASVERTPSAAGAGAYTIQLGVFSKRANAGTVARSAGPAANRIGLGPPRITLRQVNGRELHVVQVGSFGSRAEAENARRRLGQSDSIVAAVSR